ncbi:MAG: hypothetical protein GX937_10530 [Lentisphaerae bacterium]|nr:hypothetical protein [Lentisphaerota bacterium]
MSRHIFIKSFEILTLALVGLAVLVGCEQQPVPPYNRLNGQLLLEACGAMAQGRHDEAEAALQRLVDLEPGNSFAVDALRHEERRRHLEATNLMLATGDYHQLRLFLARIEKEGASSPELLTLRSVADGLEALTAVCARRPWETSGDVEKALDDLEPHVAALADSSRFQEFHRQLQSDLAVLRERELQAKIDAALTALDEAAFVGVDTVFAQAEAFRRNFPQHMFSKCWQELPTLTTAAALRKLVGSGAGMATADSRTALAVAGVMVWERLAPPVQAELAKMMSRESKSLPLCRRWIVVRQMDTKAGYEDLLVRLRAERPQLGLPSALVARYVSKGLVSSQEQLAWCWQSPCPGVTELFSRLQQIRTKNNPNSTRKK